MIKSTVTATLISIAVASRLAGVSQSTLRRWENENKISSYRTSGNHRRYCREELMRHLGEEEQSSEAAIIIYARLSSAKQDKVKEGGLDGQIEEVKKFIKDKYGEKDVIVYSDIASGLNYDRPGLSKLLNDVMSGKFYGSTIYINHVDRLARWGSSLIESVCSKFGVTIEYVNTRGDKGSDAELVDDLLNVLNYFVASKNGKRNAAKRRQYIAPEVREKIIRLWNENQFGVDIYRILHEDGDTCLNGTRVPQKLIYRVLNSIPGTSLRRGRPTKEAEKKAGRIE